MQGRILERETTSICHMEIREHKNLRWLVSKDGVLHGAMSLTEPNNPLVPYIRSMLIAQFMKPNAIKVLNLGLGSGAIERYLHEAHSHIKQITVEISQRRVEQTKRYFGIPPSSSVVIGDAYEYIGHTRMPKDIIYCDLFDVRRNFNTLLTQEFIIKLSERLSDQGVLAINYVLESQSKLVSLLVTLRKMFSTTAIIEVEGHLNLIILAIKGYKPDVRHISTSINSFYDIYRLNFRETLDTIKWLPDL